MAKVEISEILKNQILKKFKQESKIIFKLMFSLEENPRKGKLLGVVGGIAIKEMRYKSFRFYFVTDNEKLRFFDEDNLKSLLIRFIKMSDKKDQQEVIENIKKILINFNVDDFKKVR
jgi:hypothetical protein